MSVQPWIEHKSLPDSPPAGFFIFWRITMSQTEAKVEYLRVEKESRPEWRDNREARERLYEEALMRHILRVRVQGVRWV
jgi:hypothetical protein